MQSGSTPTLDANAQHPPEIRADDPRHLGNLTKKMNMINMQVSSDTKYDPAPPPRVNKEGKPVKESFVAAIPATDIQLQDEFLHLLRAGVYLVITGILVTLLDPSLRKYMLSMRYGLHFVGIAFILSIISLIYINDTQRRIRYEIWHPSPV